MKQVYVFPVTAFIAAVLVGLVMGAAWVFGRFVMGCKAVDAAIDRILDGCL